MNEKNDLETRRWLSLPPKHDEVKILLFWSGEGSGRLSLPFDNGTVRVEFERDAKPKPSSRSYTRN
jgi:hypothetical protein